MAVPPGQTRDLLAAIQGFVQAYGKDQRYQTVVSDLSDVVDELSGDAQDAGPSPGQRAAVSAAGDSEEPGENPKEEAGESAAQEDAEPEPGEAPDKPKTFAAATSAAKKRMAGR